MKNRLGYRVVVPAGFGSDRPTPDVGVRSSVSASDFGSCKLDLPTTTLMTIMAISTKNRRKLKLANSDYVWWIAENYGPGFVLAVVSSDKKFAVKYLLDQKKGDEYVVVTGQQFAGDLEDSELGCWRRFLCPRFDDGPVTPSRVRKLIEWCLDPSLLRNKISWRTHSLMI